MLCLSPSESWRVIMQSSPGRDVFKDVLLAVEQTVFVGELRLSAASRLADDLKLGRFGRIRLALYLEETFDVELPDEDVVGFNTVGDIVRYMNRWSFETASDSLPPSH
jgi:acyl carrier protein